MQIGPRSGAKTPDFQIPADLPPGPLRAIIDIKIRRVESLRPGIVRRIAGANDEQALVKWREHVVAGAGVETVLATDGSEAALLRHGSVFYLAGEPNSALAQRIIRVLLANAGLTALELPEDIRIRDNGELRYVFNHGPNAADIAHLTGGRELLLGNAMLEPCGVAVLGPTPSKAGG